MIPLRTAYEDQMIPFATTDDQRVELAKVVSQMADTGLSVEFCAAAGELARIDQGVFELMALWLEADNDHDRDETIADIEEIVDEAKELPSSPVDKPRLRSGQLEQVAADLGELKNRLRALVEENGGVSAVARNAGMQQPALSRLLNSGAMPRRSTLVRLANAMNVSESQFATDWAC